MLGGGIGGDDVTNTMVCSNRDSVPIALTFPTGQNTIHLTEDQLCAAAGVSSPAALQLNGIEFTGGVNDSSHPVGIAVKGTHRGQAYGLPTLSRVVHVSPNKDGTASAVATMAVLPSGASSMSVHHKFTSVETGAVAKWNDHSKMTEADRDGAIKKATVWKDEHGMTPDDLRKHCFAAEQGGVTRWAIPILADPHDAVGLSKLVSLNHGTSEGNAKIAKMFPTSNTKTTVDMVNPKLGKMQEIPHLVVSDRDCTDAANQMAKNLAPTTGSGTLTFTAHHASSATDAPDGEVHATCVFHRTPLAGPENDLNYLHIGAASDILKRNGIPTKSAIPSVSSNASKMFEHSAPDGAPAGGVAAIVSAPPDGSDEVDE